MAGLGNLFSDLLAQASAFPFGEALLILAGTLLVAFIAIPIFTGIINRLTSRTQTDIDDKLTAILRGPLFNVILLAGISIALTTTPLPEMVVRVTQLIIYTLLAFVIVRAAVRVIQTLLDGASQVKRVEFINKQTLPLFNNLSFIVVWAAGLYALFLIWGIDVTAWLASAGIVGIAVGFAAKDTLANLISGVFILADTPYKIGDFIVLDSGERGQVTHVGLRSTRILTRSDTEITIPNSVMGGSKITNETGGPHKKFRVSAAVGVSYNSDVEKVEELLLGIARNEELACDEPEPVARFVAFGDSSLDFNLNFWVEEPVLRGRALHAVNREIYKRFAEEGIEIPFPQRDVNLKK